MSLHRHKSTVSGARRCAAPGASGVTPAVVRLRASVPATVALCERPGVQRQNAASSCFSPVLLFNDFVSHGFVARPSYGEKWPSAVVRQARGSRTRLAPVALCASGNGGRPRGSTPTLTVGKAGWNSNWSFGGARFQATNCRPR